MDLSQIIEGNKEEEEERQEAGAEGVSTVEREGALSGLANCSTWYPPPHQYLGEPCFIPRSKKHSDTNHHLEEPKAQSSGKAETLTPQEKLTEGEEEEEEEERKTRPYQRGKGGREEEDDGYILSYLFDGHTNQTHAVLFDARDIGQGPIYTSPAFPVYMPIGLHGSFVPNLLSSKEAREFDTV